MVGLEDLRVNESVGNLGRSDPWTRPASVEDLVSVLVSLGADRVRLDYEHHVGYELTDPDTLRWMDFPAGTYLLWPLSGVPTEGES